MFEVSRGAGKWAYHYLTSSDGKAWRDSLLQGKVADRSTVYKNPFRNVWVWSCEAQRPCAKKAATYLHCPRPRLARYKDPVAKPRPPGRPQIFLVRGHGQTSKAPVLQNNDGSPGIYNQDAIPYESIMPNLFSVWRDPRNDVCARDGELKRNEIMLGIFTRRLFLVSRGYEPFPCCR